MKQTKDKRVTSPPVMGEGLGKEFFDFRNFVIWKSNLFYRGCIPSNQELRTKSFVLEIVLHDTRLVAMHQKTCRRFWLLAIAVLLFLKVSEQFGHDDEEDIAHHGKDPRKYNFAALTSGAELIDYSPKNGKGFKHLLSDDRDKYALFSCYEKKWVIIGLSEDVLIESIVIASYERYSSIVKDFQILAAVSFPQSNWIYLGNYTAEARLGEQVFHVLQPSNLHTRFVKIRFFNHNFNEDLCTMSQIKVYGKTIYETIKTGMETMFTEDANKAQYEDEVEDFHYPNDTVIDSVSQENLQGNRADESNLVDSEVGSANSTKDQSDINEEQNSPNQDERRSSELSRDAVNSDSENLVAANEIASKDDLILTPEDNSETNTNNIDTGDSGKGKDQDNLTSNESVNSAVDSSSAVFDTDSGRKSFNDAEWKLINDAFNRFNVTEPLYAKMIRRVSEFFINPLNPFGKALNRSNLDSFFADLNDRAHIANEQRETQFPPLETVTAIDSQETSSTEQRNEGSSEETINEENAEKAKGVPLSVAVDTNDSNAICSTSLLEDKSKIHLETSAPPQNGESKDYSSSETSLSTNTADAPPTAPTTVESTVDIKSSSLPSELNISTTSASNGNGFTSDNKSSVQKVPISEISEISIVAGTVSNQPIDCLSVLKFAEFRKKRLKEEKENNGNQSENDKTNVFNKLFIRIKSIETNEDIIGYFFDEVKEYIFLSIFALPFNFF